MKRHGNLYEKIYSLENLRLADKIASRGKSKQPGVIEHRKNAESNILELHESLKKGTYKTSEYYCFILKEKKEREIHRLPYYPDRIVHHAIMNILEPILLDTFTSNTYSCIKKRGIHKALRDVGKALEDVDNTVYCLKLDIKKFYPNIDNGILKLLLRKKFKDYKLLNLLDEIIDSRVGIPIGNLLSQWFANFYLTYFDHWIKEKVKVQYYFRYCDDLVILHKDKKYLHILRRLIDEYLAQHLKLEVKGNWQVFSIAIRGLDFVGYKSYHDYTRLRKSIKKSFVKMIIRRPRQASVNAYYGWLKHCDGRNLMNKYITNT